MTDDFEVGVHVEWNSEAGRVRGTIKKKRTSEITFKATRFMLRRKSRSADAADTICGLNSKFRGTQATAVS